MADYQLSLYTPVLQGRGIVEDITAKAGGWRRSIHAQGGAYEGSFRLNAPPNTLMDWFYNRLGFHIEEVCGGRTWTGMIYEMELGYDGSTRRRSLDAMANLVAVNYIGNLTNAQSIARYGRREEWLTLDGGTDAQCQAYRATKLAESAWPYPRTVTASITKGETYLDVSCRGYCFPLNWRHSTTQTGVAANLSTYLDAILDADCTDFVTVGSLATNTLQCPQSTSGPQRAWDLMQQLVKLGDSNGAPYRLWIDADRKAHYAQVSTTPAYVIRAEGLYSAAFGSKVRPWQVQPGVVRDARYPMARVEAGSWLLDMRDSYIETVEVDGEGRLSMGTGLWDAAEMYSMQAAIEVERAAKEKAAADAAYDAASVNKDQWWAWLVSTGQSTAYNWYWTGTGWTHD